MAVRVAEKEIRRLVRVYRQAVTELASTFVGQIDFEKARNFALIRQMLEVLESVDSRTERWANRNIRKIYQAIQKETLGQLRAKGLTKRIEGATQAYSVINKAAVEALLVDPESGFLTSMRGATQQIRNRMRKIQNMAKVIRDQQKIIDETIARVGILQGRDIRTVRNALVRDLLSKKARTDLIWQPRLRNLGPNHIFSTMAEIPYVKGPSGRLFRLDTYADLVARTKSRQAMTLARRNKLRQYGQGLIQVSRNLSKWDDACDLYIGRVFAITAKAAREWDVPHVDQLPGGGIPFHPNCTHTELAFFPEYTSQEALEVATSRPPSWALGKTWNEVNKLYKAKGGKAFGLRQNPAMRTAQNSGGRRRRSS